MKKNMSHRLPFREGTLFSGTRINRGKPVHFELNGQAIKGYRGDSVLSALLGSGVDTFGETQSGPIALLPCFCPPVRFEEQDNPENFPFPMERTPIREGMKLHSFSGENRNLTQHRAGLRGLARAIGLEKNSSLDFDFEHNPALPDPWAGLGPEGVGDFDLVVVGGGVAGLSAARAGLENGWRVALIEQGPDLGGSAEFFGAVEGESRPAEFISGLVSDIAGAENIAIFKNARAVLVEQGLVRAHQVDDETDVPTSRLLELRTRQIILATGVLERLPVFAGNRLPGVIGARNAFYLAQRYGLWRGKTAAYCTSSSVATQVALLGADLNVSIQKLADSRAVPKSRFFEFAKAYGVSLATGTLVAQARHNKRKRLEVRFGLAGDARVQVGEETEVDRLVVCGGWQPDLMLWHSLGGETRWSREHQQLQACGTLENIELAGACIGAASMTQCRESAELAVHNLQNSKRRSVVFDLRINEYESADGKLPVAEQFDDPSQCFLDACQTLARPQIRQKPRLWQKIFPTTRKDDESHARSFNGYSLNDIVAKVVLGEIPEAYAGIFARERCLISHDLVDNRARSAKAEPAPGQGKITAPAYLKGRFGSDEKIVELKLNGRERPEVGCFVFHSREHHLAGEAIGCILEINDDTQNRVTAYLAGGAGDEQRELFIRVGTQIIPALPYKADR